MGYITVQIKSPKNPNPVVNDLPQDKTLKQIIEGEGLSVMRDQFKVFVQGKIVSSISLTINELQQQYSSNTSEDPLQIEITGIQSQATNFTVSDTIQVSIKTFKRRNEITYQFPKSMTFLQVLGKEQIQLNENPAIFVNGTELENKDLNKSLDSVQIKARTQIMRIEINVAANGGE